MPWGQADAEERVLPLAHEHETGRQPEFLYQRNIVIESQLASDTDAETGSDHDVYSAAGHQGETGRESAEAEDSAAGLGFTAPGGTWTAQIFG